MSTNAQPSTTVNVLVVLVSLVNLGMVWLTFRVLALYPAPALRRRSLQRAASAFLTAGLSWKQRLSSAIAAFVRRAGWLLYPTLFVIVFLPIPLRAGPLDSPAASDHLLSTLWQVVAAALGVTVALVAFAFEAFTSTAQNRYGGTLREFAGETRLLLVIRVGALSLLVDGAVLLGIGSDAPAGWAAAWAIALSATALALVPWVATRILSVLDPTQLTVRRRRRLITTVGEAVRAQLAGQAAEVVLQRLGPLFPTSRVFLPDYGIQHVAATTQGEVTDVWLGPLARFAVRRHRRGVAIDLQLHVEIGQEVRTGETIMSAAVDLRPRDLRRVRRCVRIGRPGGVRADRRLLAQLDTLHIQAKAAIRQHRDEEWREVAALFELVLLQLPRETARLGIAFEGAVAQPGFFGYGPLQRIAGFFIEELEVAVEADATGLVPAITYLPQAIAGEAARLGAHVVAHEMLALYPRMYGLAIRGST